MHLLKYFDKLSLRPENAKELKGLILDLAIRGRLTEEWRKENPKTESASILVKRIKEDKERLTSEKLIPKSKSLSKVSNKNTPFELPPKWQWCKLIDICNHIHYGFNASAKKVYTGVRLLRITDIQNGKVNWKTVPSCSYRESDIPKYNLNTNDILIARTGGTIGKSFIVKNITVQSLFASYLLRVIPNKNTYADYLKSFTESGYYWNQIYNASSGTGQPNVSGTKLKEMIIPFPPLAEQKAIVKAVNQLMDEVDQLESQTKTRVDLRQEFIQSSLRQLTSSDSQKAWKKLQPHFTSFFDTVESIDKLKESILQLAVQGKLTKQWRKDNPDVETAAVLLEKIKAEKARLIEEKKIKKEKPLAEITEKEIPFELPKSWEWCRLKTLTNLITKGSSPKWQGVQYVSEDNGILFITSENVGNYKLLLKKKKYVERKFNDIEPRSILAKDDILMNIVGGSIGRTAKFDLDVVANINQAVTIIRLLPNHIHDYFLHFFNSPLCISYMYDKQVDNARPNLSMGNIAKFLTPLPPTLEQKEIIETVNKLFIFCDQMKSAIENRNDLSKDFLRSSIREVMEETQALA